MSWVWNQKKKYLEIYFFFASFCEADVFHVYFFENPVCLKIKVMELVYEMTDAKIYNNFCNLTVDLLPVVHMLNFIMLISHILISCFSYERTSYGCMFHSLLRLHIIL